MSLKTLLLAGTLAGTLAACSGDETALPGSRPQQPSETVTFLTAVDTLTRAAAVDNTTDNLTKFALCARVTPRQGSGEDVLRVVKRDAGTNCWTYNDPVTWREGADYQFFAVAPVSVISDGQEPAWDPASATISHLDAAKWSTDSPDLVQFHNDGATDFIYTRAHHTGHASGNGDDKMGGINLTFEHALAKVDVQFVEAFSVPYDNAREAYGVYGLTLSGTYADGSCRVLATSPASCAWSGQTGNATLDFNTDGVLDGVHILPQWTGRMLDINSDSENFPEATFKSTEHSTLITQPQYVIPTMQAGDNPNKLTELHLNFYISYFPNIYKLTKDDGRNNLTMIPRQIDIKPDAYCEENGERKYLAELLPGHHYRYVLTYHEWNIAPREAIQFGVAGVQTYITTVTGQQNAAKTRTAAGSPGSPVIEERHIVM